nr:putative ribonuclease H-like domain-containing protein [Tanacetum cinerariifolium]
MVPAAVLTQSKPVSITAVRPVSAVVPKIMVTRPRLAIKSKSPIIRYITRSQSPNTSTLHPRVTAVQAPMVSVAQGMQGKWGNPQYALKDKRVIDIGCSRHMTGNMSYLSNFKELNGGYVAFRGNPKGGKISGKGNIKTGSGPTWLFDIDSLTRTMNYQPVTTGNQTNPSASFQDNFDAEKAGEEINQHYVLFSVWSSGSANPQNYDGDAAFDGKEHDFDAKKPDFEVILSPISSAQSRKQDDKTNKEAKGKSPVESFTKYRDLSVEFEDCSAEDITYSDDENDVGVEADINNLETSITPLGFEDPDHPDKVYKVVKPLYGLHQAPRAWYETLANYLLENGFQRGKIDQTLFIKKQKGDILPVQINVDDIIFGATNKDLCKSFEKLMKDKFQMSLMGELTFFLGLRVKQKKDGIFISQDKYVAEILRKFGLTKGKSASTPIDT